jgi:hypothetical protein
MYNVMHNIKNDSVPSILGTVLSFPNTHFINSSLIMGFLEKAVFKASEPGYTNNKIIL